eukprot:CAMPEP_0178731442 /NCGR_PEP_ID=MMETSP0699-20121125/30042_1 /TAXON_ID=265572 /ORGANISM="Extubocellulus spinifer, Strain CCMP396" /LENGTH=469 /DNA_ID=CAMNT_0020383509 /DNA_START=52 /DNA_END=1461 /DNA_ORIENTATION=+
MARSAAALARRAAKRNRSEQEQRRADYADERKRQERLLLTSKKQNDTSCAAAETSTEKPSSTTANGAAMRRLGTDPSSRSTSSRPCTRTVTPPRCKSKKNVKHKLQNGAALKWNKQASPEQIAHNVTLRKRYVETNGIGMSAEDVDRAKTLIARDERRKTKKAEAKKKKKESSKGSAGVKNNKLQKMEKSKGEGKAGSMSTASTDAASKPPLAKTSSNARSITEAKKGEKVSCNTPETEPKKVANEEQKDTALTENTSNPPASIDESVDASEDEESATFNAAPPPGPSTPPRRQKRPTPMDLAWRQVALDEAAGRLPPFVAETAVEKKLERIAEKNRRDKAELARIRKLYAEDVDAGLEAIGRYAARASERSSSPPLPEDGSTRSRPRKVREAKAIEPKAVGKAMKKALKAAPNRSMKLKALRKSVRTALALKKSNKKELKNAIEARIKKKAKNFKVDGKLVSLASVKL